MLASVSNSKYSFGTGIGSNVNGTKTYRCFCIHMICLLLCYCGDAAVVKDGASPDNCRR